MNTCKTCRHWLGHRYLEGDGQRLKSCQSPLVAYGSKDAWLGGSFDESPSNGVLVEFSEGWGLFTGPDFGCVLHPMNVALEKTMVEYAALIHYPEQWDTAAYPTLEDAVHEALAWSGIRGEEIGK